MVKDKEYFEQLVNELFSIYVWLELRERARFKRSRLSRYRDLIFVLRADGKSYRTIAEILRHRYKVKVDPTTVRRFELRHLQ